MSAGLGFGAPGWVPGTGGAAEVQILRVTTLGGGRSLHLVGEIDFSSVGVLEAAFDAAFGAAASAGAHVGDVRLDMSEVDFVDVAGTRALLRAAARLGAGGRLVLDRPPRVLLMVLAFFPDPWNRVDVLPR
jgi:anti-anti-sigma regulatory factor